MNSQNLLNWQTEIEPYVARMEDMSGGFTHAQRGVITRPDGEKLFIKIGTDDQTNKWITKEAKVYTILLNAGYEHMPKLFSIKPDRTGIAIEFLDGYSFDETWDADKLNAVTAAQDDLKPLGDLFLNDDDFSPHSVVKIDNKWPILLNQQAVEWLSGRLPELGANTEISLSLLTEVSKLNENWSLKTDTLTHQDIRADNFGYDPKTKTGKLIDWNWLCIGDASLDTTPLFLNMYRSGFDPYALHPEKYDAAMFAYLISFWLETIYSGRYTDTERDLRRRQSQALNVRTCFEILNKYGK